MKGEQLSNNPPRVIPEGAETFDGGSVKLYLKGIPQIRRIAHRMIGKPGNTEFVREEELEEKQTRGRLPNLAAQEFHTSKGS